MKVLGIIGILFAVMAGGFMIKLIMFPVHVLNNEANLAHDAIDKVMNADNAIYNYEWFKQKLADIEATKRQFKLAEANQKSYRASLGERSTWTFEDKTEDARLNSVVLGLQTNLESQIGDYNARASMATRNIFEDHVLPDFIDALTFIRN